MLSLSHLSMFVVKWPCGSPRECGRFEADVGVTRGRTAQARPEHHASSGCVRFPSCLRPRREGQRLGPHAVTRP